ncbi:MAG: redoxin domain-containing protein, partial [Acidimicrobiaceae bacterium]
MFMLKPGSKAPKIELLDQNGKPFSLAKLGKKKVLVYFYPKADTPGCTTQSCGLRDILGDIGRT